MLLNQQIRDNSNALIAQCRTYKNYSSVDPGVGGAGLANGGIYPVDWDGYVLDPLGMTMGSTTRITAPIAGWYTVRGSVGGFASFGWQTLIFKNGSHVLTGTAGTGDSTVGEYDLALAAGDYLELLIEVFAGTGGFHMSPSLGNERSMLLPDQGIYTAADLEVGWVGP